MEFEHKVGALDDEDLVVGEKEEKNWKGIVISLLVIGSILGAIIIAITLCTPTNDVDNNKFKLDFDHVISDAFRDRPFNGTWLSERELVYVDQNGSIVIFDAQANRSDSILVKTHDKTLHTMTKFSLSSDRKSILFVADEHFEFGAPVSIRYAIFNVSVQTVEFLDDLIKGGCALKSGKVQYAAWGHTANSIVLIASDDIYYVPDFTRLSSSGGGKCLRLTKTGQLSESIKNGMPDSFYRNTLFQESEAEAQLLWSKDGHYLAYPTFDDAAVESTPIDYFDNYLQAANNNPKIHYEHYPRAGTNLPRVTIHIADMSNSMNAEAIDSVIVPLPLDQIQPDPKLGFYISYMDWVDERDPKLLVLLSNRAQNSSVLVECGNYEIQRDDSFFARSRSSAWRCQQLTTFSSRIPPNVDAKRFILTAHNSNNSRLIFVSLPRPDSEIGEHHHVALLRSDERAPKYNVYLTHGEFDVDQLLAYDPKTDSLYFEVKISERAERHLYKISNVAQNSMRQIKCLTCNLEEPCSYNQVYMNRAFKYLVHECLGPSVPVTRMRLLEGDRLASLRDLNSNEALENLVKSKQMPKIQYIAVPTNQQYPYKCHIKLYLPNEIEEEKDKRFPLLIESSEIDKRKIWKKFELDWGQYLASRKQLIYARVDCIRTRSSSGSQSSSATGGHWTGDHDELLAESPLFNAKDQIESIKFLLENVDHFPYIDRRRVAIWGPTSTSAYVALATTASDDSKLIQCTIAVSPITNWRYMNAYMAEHYLGLPSVDSNSLKYERANLLKRSYDFAMRKLLVVHGTADEQVLVQNTMQFVKALTEHHMIGGYIHQMQLYPDVGHSLGQVKRHFYLTLDGFIDRCFYQKPIAIKATEWKGKVRPKLY